MLDENIQILVATENSKAISFQWNGLTENQKRGITFEEIYPVLTIVNYKTPKWKEIHRITREKIKFREQAQLLLEIIPDGVPEWYKIWRLATILPKQQH